MITHDNPEYLITVRRYDTPALFGLHAVQDGQIRTVGLFNAQDLLAKLHDEFPTAELTDQADIHTLIGTAPIEWHKSLINGDFETINRFKTYRLIDSYS